MNSISPELLLDIWQKGKFLDEAVFIFCDQKYIDGYSEINFVRKPPTSDEIKISDLLNEMNTSLKGLYDIQTAKDDLYNNLYQKLKKGDLVGLGYEAPLKSTDFPIQIPPHMWPPQKLGKNSAISGNGLNFLSVRIVRKSALKSKMRNKDNFIKKTILPEIKIKDKKTGRPSIKNEIISAYNLLKKEEKIDYSKPLKSHTELIQKTVQILFPEIETTAGMGIEAIRRAIGDIFKQDKTTSKPTSKL